MVEIFNVKTIGIRNGKWECYLVSNVCFKLFFRTYAKEMISLVNFLQKAMWYQLISAIVFKWMGCKYFACKC